MLTPPREIVDMLDKFDQRHDVFSVHDVSSAIGDAARKLTNLTDEQKRGAWPEQAAFDFYTTSDEKRKPWGLYFKPACSFEREDGLFCNPDIKDVDEGVIDHWSQRSKQASHPVLIARYSDLVWELSCRASQKKPDIVFARRAIDAYLRVAGIDDGSTWSDTTKSLQRACDLAIRVNDRDRVSRVAQCILDYVDRIADVSQPRTYVNLLDFLLTQAKPCSLTDEQLGAITARLEAALASRLDAVLRGDGGPVQLWRTGEVLAAHYQRTRCKEDVSRILQTMARAHEHASDNTGGIRAHYELQRALKLYEQADMREESDRVRRRIEAISHEVVASIPAMTVTTKVDKELIDALHHVLDRGGLDELVLQFLPKQDELDQWICERRENFPLSELFAPVLIDGEGGGANVNDTAGDVDGPRIRETAERIRLSQPFLMMAWDYLLEKGLAAEHFVRHLRQSPAFEKDRFPIIREGVEAYFAGDYVKAAHVLLPAIERALNHLLKLLERPRTKGTRGGRASALQRNINDVLADDVAREALGPDLRLFLLATLSHPKGLNIRNVVCHGLLSPGSFTRHLCELILLALLAVALMRERDADPESEDQDIKS